MKVPLADWKCSPRERELVNKVLDSGWLTYGPYCKELERVWSEYHGCKYGVVNSSGTAALQLAFRALKEVHVWSNDAEILVPAITFPATINMVIESGLKPVLCDVCESDGMLDVGDMRKRITSKTVGVCVVHLWGTPYPRKKELLDFCIKQGLKIVEDSCETISRDVGNWGEVSCFSQYFNHIISAGVGGMACTNSKELEDIMRSLANHGMRDTNVIPKYKRFTFVRVGYSMRITELEAALGVAQWEKIEDTLAYRRQISDCLTEELERIGLHSHARLIGGTMMYPVLFKEVSGPDLGKLMEYLDTKGVETRTAMPITDQDVYNGKGKLVPTFDDYETYPVARKFNNSGIFFPIHPMMTREHCHHIAKYVEKFMDKWGYNGEIRWKRANRGA